MNALLRVLDHPAAAWLARAALAAVFVFAAWPKLLHPDAFATAVLGYAILPERLVGLFAVVLPGVELAAVGGLCRKRTRAAGEILLSLLLGLFIFAAAVALARGLAGIDCGCFGPGHSRALGALLVAQDAGLLLLAMVALRASYRQR